MVGRPSAFAVTPLGSDLSEKKRIGIRLPTTKAGILALLDHLPQDAVEKQHTMVALMTKNANATFPQENMSELGAGVVAALEKITGLASLSSSERGPKRELSPVEREQCNHMLGGLTKALLFSEYNRVTFFGTNNGNTDRGTFAIKATAEHAVQVIQRLDDAKIAYTKNEKPLSPGGVEIIVDPWQKGFMQKLEQSLSAGTDGVGSAKKISGIIKTALGVVTQPSRSSQASSEAARILWGSHATELGG